MYIRKTLIIIILIGLFFPTWTRRIAGENSISEHGKIEIKGTRLAVMIRGYQKDNHFVIVVHGGPCSFWIIIYLQFYDIFVSIKIKSL